MHKTLTVLLASIAIVLTSFTPPQTQWELIKKKDGVSFYETHRDSRVNGMVHSIIKIENDNGHPVKVTFTPQITCNGIALEEKALTCTLDVEDSFEQQYKTCEKGALVEVGLTQITIVNL